MGWVNSGYQARRLGLDPYDETAAIEEELRQASIVIADAIGATPQLHPIPQLKYVPALEDHIAAAEVGAHAILG